MKVKIVNTMTLCAIGVPLIIMRMGFIVNEVVNGIVSFKEFVNGVLVVCRFTYYPLVGSTIGLNSVGRTCKKGTFDIYNCFSELSRFVRLGIVNGNEGRHDKSDGIGLLLTHLGNFACTSYDVRRFTLAGTHYFIIFSRVRV